MSKSLFLVFLLAFGMATSAQDTKADLAAKAAKTNIKALPYDPAHIVVRGFDGQNPPPRLVVPDKPLFYGYGITAYIKTADSLRFFTIVQLDAVHRDGSGNEIARFTETGSRYSEAFKEYFLSKIAPTEKKNIYFENVFVKDKNENLLKLTRTFRFCPHCP